MDQPGTGGTGAAVVSVGYVGEGDVPEGAEDGGGIGAGDTPDGVLNFDIVDEVNRGFVCGDPLVHEGVDDGDVFVG